jgi:hypothetical protein
MPNLNEFLNKDTAKAAQNLSEEKIDGIRPCSKCNLDVDGGMWDSENLLLSWVCKDGHYNSYKIN